MTVLRLSHVGICVTDLEQAIRFYTEVFGFRCVSQIDARGRAVETLLELPGADLSAVFLERDGTRIELLSFRAPGTRAEFLRSINQPGLTHLSFRVSDIDHTVGQVIAAGGSCLAHSRVDSRGSRSVFVLDPARTRIELLETPMDLDWLPGLRTA